MQRTFYEYALVKTAELTEADQAMCIKNDSRMRRTNAGNYNPADARKRGTYSHEMFQAGKRDYLDNCLDTARGAIPVTYGHGQVGDHLFANDRLMREAKKVCKARLTQAVKNPDVSIDGQNPLNMDVQNNINSTREWMAGDRKYCGLPAAPYSGRAWKGPVNYDWKEGMMRRNGVPMVAYDEDKRESYFADRVSKKKVNPFNVGKPAKRKITK